MTGKQTEVEETLGRLTSHKGVRGIVLLNSEGEMVRSTLETTLANYYASLLIQLAANTRTVVRELDSQNDLSFLKIRTKKHHIMVAPDREYVLIVIQDPNASEAAPPMPLEVPPQLREQLRAAAEAADAAKRAEAAKAAEAAQRLEMAASAAATVANGGGDVAPPPPPPAPPAADEGYGQVTYDQQFDAGIVGQQQQAYDQQAYDQQYEAGVGQAGQELNGHDHYGHDEPAVVTLAVEVPEGVEPGHQIQIQTEDGQTLQVEVPDGVGPGDVFNVQYQPA
jgi:dynein light chain roadblock-type